MRVGRPHYHTYSNFPSFPPTTQAFHTIYSTRPVCYEISTDCRVMKQIPVPLSGDFPFWTSTSNVTAPERNGNHRLNSVDHGGECSASAVNTQQASNSFGSPKHVRAHNDERPNRRQPPVLRQSISISRVYQIHTYVDILKCPAWNTAHRTYPITALSTNDAARASIRNVSSVNSA